MNLQFDDGFQLRSSLKSERLKAQGPLIIGQRVMLCCVRLTAGLSAGTAPSWLTWGKNTNSHGAQENRKNTPELKNKLKAFWYSLMSRRLTRYYFEGRLVFSRAIHTPVGLKRSPTYPWCKDKTSTVVWSTRHRASSACLPYPFHPWIRILWCAHNLLVAVILRNLKWSFHAHEKQVFKKVIVAVVFILHSWKEWFLTQLKRMIFY